MQSNRKMHKGNKLGNTQKKKPEWQVNMWKDAQSH